MKITKIVKYATWNEVDIQTDRGITYYLRRWPVRSGGLWKIFDDEWVNVPDLFYEIIENLYQAYLSKE